MVASLLKSSFATVGINALNIIAKAMNKAVMICWIKSILGKGINMRYIYHDNAHIKSEYKA
jgi:hypothetical protein